MDPILDFTLLRSGIGWEVGVVRPRAEPGDLGGVRTTATFFTSRLGVDDLLAGERLPGLLTPSTDSVLLAVIIFAALLPPAVLETFTPSSAVPFTAALPLSRGEGMPDLLRGEEEELAWRL